MFDRLRGKQPKDLYAGLTLHRQGVAAALLRALPDGGVRVERVCWRAAAEGEVAQDLIPQVLRDCHIGKAPLTTVLALDSYALLQIETPDIPTEELHDALRWRIKDMVDFPVEDAVIDSFALPPGKRPGAPLLSYVVAAPKKRIDGLHDVLDKSNVRLHAIDVPEMAIRDLVMHSANGERPHAYLHIQPQHALIEICVADQIYLTRHIPLSADLLDLEAQQQVTNMESLVLEAQRSLDYFESQYGMGPVDQLSVLSSSAQAEQSFMHSATVYLTVPVGTLSLQALQGVEDVDESILRHALAAVGAAIREMPCAA